MKQIIINWIKSFYGISKDASLDKLIQNQEFQNQQYLWVLGLLFAVAILSFILWFVTREILLKIVPKLAEKTKTRLDNNLVETKFFSSISYLIPLLPLDYFFSIIFFTLPKIEDFSERINDGLIILVLLISLRRFFKALGKTLSEKPFFKGKPINAYVQTFNIIITIVLGILMISVFTKQSPLYFLTSIGAMTAILLLIFKDTILGFVGSIQLSANDMVRTGDWVTIEKFGADGDVIEINLTTVKVQNFDMTITTVPTYSFISDSFKNWRGMSESGGRRIKRAIHIQIDTIKFASPKLLQSLSETSLLHNFIKERQEEIEKFNQERGIDEDQINARRQTNLGLFRRYLEYYLRHHLYVHQNMTIMVRQLPPSENGIPIEIYCFTNTTIWAEYEAIMADIFDHVFSIVKRFELRVFENPSGNDFKKSFSRDSD
jgi:miniconductance mechanosensitive channel